MSGELLYRWLLVITRFAQYSDNSQAVHSCVNNSWASFEFLSCPHWFTTLFVSDCTFFSIGVCGQFTWRRSNERQFVQPIALWRMLTAMTAVNCKENSWNSCYKYNSLTYEFINMKFQLQHWNLLKYLTTQFTHIESIGGNQISKRLYLPFAFLYWAKNMYKKSSDLVLNYSSTMKLTLIVLITLGVVQVNIFVTLKMSNFQH